jgi:hypothetical protein
MNWGDAMTWLDQHNGLVTALATVALAALTAVLAIENRRLLLASADATAATKRALDLDWRPVLTFHHATETSTITGAFTMISAATYVRNVGRGPALNVRFLRRKRNDDGTPDWQMTKRFSLAGGDTVSEHSWVTTDPGKGVPHQGEPPDEVWGAAFPQAREVLICQDQGGQLYRFVDPEPLEWRAGDPRKAWVEWYRGLLASE